jgi:hypothetical protein
MMTRDEARKALMLYRPGTPDAADPEIAEALALAKQDPELSQWLDLHCAQHEILRGKIRQIPVPAGLKDRIISQRMTPDEARKMLLLYRPGTSDAADPEIARALTVAKHDPELSRWLDQHCAEQEALRAKIRQIPVPAGLKEQIISERVVLTQKRFTRQVIALAAASACVVLIGWWAALVWQVPPDDDTFANYQSRMVSGALRGYSMDYESSDATKIRDYLGQKKAVENYELPAGLQKAAATGCAVKYWQGAKVAMLCFRTGKPLPPGGNSDLWLFVVDRDSVKGAPVATSPQFAKVNKLMTATWTQGNKLYFLGAVGDEGMIRGLF